MSESIALKTYRLTLRKARIEVQDGTLALFVPYYFGRRRWTIPIDEVAVADLTSPLLNDQAPELLFRHPVHVPYLVTTGLATVPTTLLLFRTPQRVPPLRHTLAFSDPTGFPFSPRQSRSAKGARLDGALLRAHEPEDAASRLAAAGATPVTAPTQWLQQHREVVTDPVEQESIESRITRGSSLGRASLMLLWGALGAGVLLRLAGGPPGLMVPVVAAIFLGLALNAVAWRIATTPGAATDLAEHSQATPSPDSTSDRS